MFAYRNYRSTALLSLPKGLISTHGFYLYALLQSLWKTTISMHCLNCHNLYALLQSWGQKLKFYFIVGFKRFAFFGFVDFSSFTFTPSIFHFFIGLIRTSDQRIVGRTQLPTIRQLCPFVVQLWKCSRSQNIFYFISTFHFPFHSFYYYLAKPWPHFR